MTKNMTNGTKCLKHYMTKIANETGLSRPSLYKALSDGSKPQFETIMKVLRAIGGQIQINPSSEEMAIS